MLPDDPGLGQPGWGLQLLGAVAPTALSPQRATVAVAAAAKGSRYAPWQQRADSSAPCTPNGRTFQAEPPWAPQHLSLGWGHPTVVSPPPPRDPEWLGDPVPRQPQGHCWLRRALGASGVGPTIISGVYWKRKRIGNPSLSGLCRGRDTRRQRQAELSTAGQMVPGCCTDMWTLTRGHTDTHTHSLNATLALSLTHRTQNRVGGGHCLASGT